MVMRNGDTNPPGPLNDNRNGNGRRHVSKEQMFMEKYHDLADRARQKGLVVEFKSDKVLKDYLGMNWLVGKQLGFPIPDHCLYISDSASWKDKYETLVHELIEVKYMTRDDTYWPGHCRAMIMQDDFDQVGTELPDHWIIDVHILKSDGKSRKIAHRHKSRRSARGQTAVAAAR